MTKGSPDRKTASRAPLYTPEQRARRDCSPWTIVQGVLAPVQFLACLVSIVLIQHFLATGQGLAVANLSVLVKTFLLYLIMVTGAVWEKQVFGQYLFAPAFFWEDVVSMGVMALHAAYLLAWWGDWLSPTGLMLLALSAYSAYLINAVQFVLKLRAARRSGRQSDTPATPVGSLAPSTLHNAAGTAR